MKSSHVGNLNRTKWPDSTRHVSSWPRSVNKQRFLAASWYMQIVDSFLATSGLYSLYIVMYVCQLSIMWRTTWRVDSTPDLIVIVPWRRHATSYLWNEIWSELTLPIFSTQKKNGPWANQSCCSTENLSTELLVGLFSFRYWTGWESRCPPISAVGL